MPATAWLEFETAARELRSLESIDGLVGWDFETMLPPKAAQARGNQRGALRAVMHEKLVGEQFGDLLENASSLTTLDDRQRAMIRVVKRDRTRELKIPTRLVTELAEAQAAGVEAWKAARAADDFPSYVPFLERLLALRLEEADARGHTGERYDAMLQSYEPGMTTAKLAPALERLRLALVPLVDEVTARPPPRTDFLSRDAYDTDAQYAFSLELSRGIGFDMAAGRLDRSVHPFCQGMCPTDVRITTRLFRNDGANGLYSVLHESGHGLYEQGLPADGSPLSAGSSMGLHESQSRLWENLIGRSRPYWTHWFPKLKERFPEALNDVSLDEWLSAVNCIRRSLIRVDADEATYNLHIVVRFELEWALVHGELSVADLPGAWNERYEKVVGVTPPDNKQGVLQDIHWSGGDFGYFPTYALGNMYAASLMKAAERSIPNFWSHIEKGNCTELRHWLRVNVHKHGRAIDADEIVRRATGAGLTERDLVAYLKAKYGVA